ncbi:MAG: transposase [Candidatus Ornithospirochaeta sp.]
MKRYKSNDNTVYSCKCHVVWCPKYRRKVLTIENQKISQRQKDKQG